MKKFFKNFKNALNISDYFFGTPYNINTLTSIITTVIEKSIGVSKNETSNKVEEASLHLNKANIILNELQKELGERKEELDNLLKSISEKEVDVKQWESLSEVKKDLANALIIEINDSVKKEFDKDKTPGKKFFSFIIWLITLLLGGIVGALIQKYVIVIK